MRWSIILLALTLAAACDAPGAGPALPAGAHWVNFNVVPSEGPIQVREAIYAATSTAELEAAVVTSSYNPEGQCHSPCWRIYQADQRGLLYLAIATQLDACGHDVKERAAIGGRTLHFIYWVGGSNGDQCGDAEPVKRWRLVSVSRRDLPGPGMLTVRLERQGYYGSSAVESQVELI